VKKEADFVQLIQTLLMLVMSTSWSL